MLESNVPFITLIKEEASLHIECKELFDTFTKKLQDAENLEKREAQRMFLHLVLLYFRSYVCASNIDPATGKYVPSTDWQEIFKKKFELEYQKNYHFDFPKIRKEIEVSLYTVLLSHMCLYK